MIIWKPLNNFNEKLKKKQNKKQPGFSRFLPHPRLSATDCVRWCGLGANKSPVVLEFPPTSLGDCLALIQFSGCPKQQKNETEVTHQLPCPCRLLSQQHLWKEGAYPSKLAFYRRCELWQCCICSPLSPSRCMRRDLIRIFNEVLNSADLKSHLVGSKRSCKTPCWENRNQILPPL